MSIKLSGSFAAGEPPGRSDIASLMRPVPRTAKFSEEGYHVWCGTLLRDDAGLFHLYYSRWPLECGFEAWVTRSEVAHAVAGNPLGPFRPKDVALPARGREFWDGLCTHNPTVMRFGSKYYIYYTGNTGDGRVMSELNWTHRNNQRVGVAVAESPDGPWKRFDRPLIDATPGFHDELCCNNPSVTARPDGGYLMVYKAVGARGKLPFGGPVVHVAATAANPLGPFTKQPDAVFGREGESFPAEDPFIWAAGSRYRAIVKDNGGHFTDRGRALVLFESRDGLRWTPAEFPLVTTPEIAWEGGERQVLERLERPQLWMDAGRPAILLCAARERDGSTFNVRIPLAA